MRELALAEPVIRQLATHEQWQFADQTAWPHHLEQLGITALQVPPDPTRVATEGALLGAPLPRCLGHGRDARVGDMAQANPRRACQSLASAARAIA